MTSATEALTGSRLSRLSELRHNKTLVFGSGLLAVVVGAVLLAPVLSGHDPDAQDLKSVLASPSWNHLLGTDELGRDTWARLLYAGRIDLLIGVTAVVAPFLIGTAVGLFTGYRGGGVDAGIMRVVDVVVAFPFYILVIAVVFALGAGVPSIFLAITLVGWMLMVLLSGWDVTWWVSTRRPVDVTTSSTSHISIAHSDSA